MTLLEMCASLIFGGGVYIIIEILYRGYSHWSMAIAGGVSFLLLHGLFSKFSGMHMILKLVACLIIISSVEFLVGYIVNMRFRWNIWDYSNHRYNLYGQVCLRYSLTWALFAIPISLISHIWGMLF
ncbi:MAG: putative ABC transporter permease [Candidatus Gastranaerophilaceae bacterium]|jgi:uncharacterized membrane protein|nr:hypothetical protein [Christensenellales bacterium]